MHANGRKILGLALATALVCAGITVAVEDGKYIPHTGEALEEIVPEPDAVNINTADAELLCTLDGIGPSTAAKIISFRSTRPFEHIRDITLVQGIGEKTFDKIKAKIRID